MPKDEEKAAFEDSVDPAGKINQPDETHPTPITRRAFFSAGTVAALGAAVLPGTLALGAAPSRHQGPLPPGGSASRDTFIDIMRAPDRVTVFAGIETPVPLTRQGQRWHTGNAAGEGVEVAFDSQSSTSNLQRQPYPGMAIHLSSPRRDLSHVHLRWHVGVSSSLLVLGDAWERSYGDLGWRSLVPQRVLPWYFATWDGSACHCYGVMTAAAALCFWQVDSEGVSLWLDVQNGGSGVELGQRRLHAATIVSRRGHRAETPFDAVRALCKLTCSRPPLSTSPVYGANDWYYAYGRNTAEQILRDTALVASLSESLTVRPFSVIDAGWQSGPPAFPDMAALAQQVRSLRVRPGIWIRPLLAPADAPATLLLPAGRFANAATAAENLAYDPTLPEAQTAIAACVGQARDWGYDLIKHDFSTYDLLGQWGFEMGPSPTRPGWSFHDRSKTNAEIILDVYKLVRHAAGGQTVLLGCNTIGNLAQGIFEIQRTGDDTSGKVWERTRRMGVNTLAFRLPQHGIYFVQDADCVGITAAIPWELNRQWLDVLGRSGAAVFVSPGPGSVGAEQRHDIAEAFKRCATGGDGARPADWLLASTPEHWDSPARQGRPEPSSVHYRWNSADGADPYSA